MAKTIVGLFDHFTSAQAALEDQVKNGFPRDQISIVTSRQASAVMAEPAQTSASRDNAAAGGAAVGAGAGAVVGGAAGLVASLAGLTIPVVGPILAAGSIVATLSGAAGGAAIGGIIGTLVGVGVPDEDAQLYEEAVRRGMTLVVLRTDDPDMAERCAAILNRHGAVDVRSRALHWGEPKTWRSPLIAPPGEPHLRTVEQVRTPGEVTPPRETVQAAPLGEGLQHPKPESSPTAQYPGERQLEKEYQTDFELLYGNSGSTYEEFAPAYRYGSQLAGEDRYLGEDFAACESDLRQRWERENPGSWQRFKEAVRYGWNQVRQKG